MLLLGVLLGFSEELDLVRVVSPGSVKRKLHSFLHSLSMDKVNGEKSTIDEQYWVCLPGELSGHKGRSKMLCIGAKHPFCLCIVLCSWISVHLQSMSNLWFPLSSHTSAQKYEILSFLLLQRMVYWALVSSSPSISNRGVSSFSCWGCCCLCSYNSPFQLCPCACIPSSHAVLSWTCRDIV